MGKTRTIPREWLRVLLRWTFAAILVFAGLGLIKLIGIDYEFSKASWSAIGVLTGLVLLIYLRYLRDFRFFKPGDTESSTEVDQVDLSPVERQLCAALSDGERRTAAGLRLRIEESGQRGAPTKAEAAAALSRLVKEGLVAQTQTGNLKYYQLTEAGYTALAGANRGGLAPEQP